MNSFKGEIIEIEREDSLSLIRIQAGDGLFSAIVIDSPETAPYLRIGNTIQLLFKETEVLIGKNVSPNSISLQNKIAGTILSIEEGKLLSRLELDSPLGRVVSIITTHAVHQLELKAGEKVFAMVKTNEIMLAE